MKINILIAIVAVCVLTLFACSVSQVHKDTISLPEGTTVETAAEIIKIIWSDKFVEKIASRFPNFNPIANASYQGISLRWYKFTPFNDEKKPTLSLQIEIKYKGSLENAEQIVQFARAIVEKHVAAYFENNLKDGLRLMTTDINSRFVENKQTGKLFVIAGNVRNHYPNPHGKIRVRCKLYTADRVLARQESVYAGVIIDEEELATASVEDILKQLRTIPHSMGTDTVALPDQKLPFMAVFTDLPKNLDEFTVEAINSVQIDISKAVSEQDRSTQDSKSNPVATSSETNIITTLEQRTVDNPDDLEGWRLLGNHYFDTDQKSKAIEAYERSLALGPDQADVWTDLGVMYRRIEKPRKAVQCFDRALFIEEDNQIALFNKGVVLINEFNDIRGTKAAWQKLVKINSQARAPNGELVKDLLEKLQERN